MQESNDTVMCPCCGQPTTPIKYKFSDKQVQHYIACTMTGVPYWRQYQLFKGAIKITVSQAAPKQGVSLQRKISQVIDKLGIGGLPIVNAVRYIILRRTAIKRVTIQSAQGQYQIYQSAHNAAELLQKLLCGQITFDSDDATQIGERVIELFQDTSLFSAVDAALLQKVMTQHAALYSWIVAQSLDENFWDGIKQD